MNKILGGLVLMVLGLMTVSAAESDRLSTERPPSQEVARLVAEFTKGYLDWRPLQGTQLGLHEYDGRITDFSRASLAAERKRLKIFADKLAAYELSSLTPSVRRSRQVVEMAIQGELFAFDDLESYTTNPMTYANALDLNTYIKRDFAPLPQRVKSIIAIERAVPKMLAAARENLVEALPKPYVELAIDITNGNADFLAKDLVTALKDVKDAALMAEFKQANDAAVAELKSYAEWLSKDRLPRAHNRYALGKDKYQRMLKGGEMIDFAPERILEIGLKELKREQAMFAEAAKRINPAKPAIEVFKDIQKDHPTEASLLPDTRKHLEMIRQFVIDKGIITIPSDVRARVEETPQFARAGSFASMDTPGPFEKANEAYYYVTPTEAEWPAAQKEEWLTAFNYYTTDVVTIHEAYPGHYVQFLNLNASKVGAVEKTFNSYAYVEGWAHYCEQMMLDEGFGVDAADPLKAAKYRLAQSDEALLRICRLCVSIKTHCEGMSVEAATKFFQDNCYYEEKPARQEAMRGTYDPGYLYYTLGKLQILKLRRDWQKQEGAAYTLKRFNDEMVNNGMPPIRLLREIMLKDAKTWAEIL